MSGSDHFQLNDLCMFFVWQGAGHRLEVSSIPWTDRTQVRYLRPYRRTWEDIQSDTSGWRWRKPPVPSKEDRLHPAPSWAKGDQQQLVEMALAKSATLCRRPCEAVDACPCLLTKLVSYIDMLCLHTRHKRRQEAECFFYFVHRVNGKFVLNNADVVKTKSVCIINYGEVRLLHTEY